MRERVVLLVLLGVCSSLAVPTQSNEVELLQLQNFLHTETHGCPENCRGHGVCVESTTDEDKMVCSCHTGFSGNACETWNGCEELNFCSGNGACRRDEGIAGSCDCNPGYRGLDCSIRLEACPRNCSGHGRCRADHSGERQCICDKGFTGDDCAHAQRRACPNNCGGHGTCQSDGTCSCDEDFHGRDCTMSTHSCPGSCGHGFCKSGKCECLSGYSGPRCAKYIRQNDTECARLSFCSGKGVCERVQNGVGQYVAQCICFVGSSGADCSIVDTNITQCPNYCNGHGRCVMVESPHCDCDPGWEGKGCEKSLCTIAANGKVCGGRGVCQVYFTSSGAQAGVCSCDASWKNGDLGICEDQRCPSACSGHGQCLENGTCVCNSPYYGEDCSVATHPSVIVATPTPTPGAPPSNTTTTTTTPTTTTTAPVQKSVDCPGGCGSHGSCVGTACVCQAGYAGTSCEFALSSEPDEFDVLDA